MILRLLHWQGALGIAACLSLAAGLLIQKGETRQWRKQSDRFEQLYSAERTAFSGTVAAYRAAAEAARAADKAAAERAAAEQRTINERTAHDFEARLSAARAAAERLRIVSQGAATDPGRGRSAAVPGLPVASAGASEAAGPNRLPDPERLIATEQAIQLDELIKWVRRQHSVDPNANGDARPKAAGARAAVRH